MSADFMSVALAAPPSMRTKLTALGDDETEHNGNVYLNCGIDVIIEIASDDLGDNLVISPNFPVFVAIDRFGANRELLNGHAARIVANEELAEFSRQWKALKASPHLIARASAAIFRGQDAAKEIKRGITAIDGALDAAKNSWGDLVLMCLPA